MSGLMRLVVCVAVAGLVVSAEAGDKFSIKETAVQTRTCDTGGCSDVRDGAITITGSYKIPKELAAAFNEETTFSLRLGAFFFQTTLGTADNYEPGDTKATYKVIGIHPITAKPLIPLHIKISWINGNFRLNAKALTPYYYDMAAGEDALIASDGEHTFETYFGLNMQASINDGFVLEHFDAPLSGKVKTKETIKGDVTTQVTKARLKAKLDFKKR